MKNILLFLLILMVNSFQLSAQDIFYNNSTIVEQILDSLVNQRIDTIAVFEKFCPDYSVSVSNEQEMCKVLPSTFIQWCQNNAIYLLRINKRCKYDVITIKDCFQLNYYEKNKFKIDLAYSQFCNNESSKNGFIISNLHGCKFSMTIYYKPYRINYLIKESKLDSKNNEKSNSDQLILRQWCNGIEEQLNGFDYPSYFKVKLENYVAILQG